MKKFYVFLFLCVISGWGLLINQAQIIQIDLSQPFSSAEDTQPPSFISCTANVSTITNGGTIRVTVAVSDDMSGINWGQLEWTTANGYKCGYGLNFGGSSTGYVDLEISPYAKSGIYYVWQFGVEDNAGNSARFYSTTTNPEDGIFCCEVTVNNLNQDLDPPIFKNIIANTTTIHNGGTVRVYVSMEDTLSGISWGQLEWYGPTRHIYGTSLNFNASGVAMVDLPIDQYARSGIYYVGSFGVVDHASNSGGFASTTIDPVNGVFTCEITVDNDIQDLTPPELISCSPNGTVLVGGGEIFVTIQMIDDLSDLSWGQAEWCGPNGPIYGTGISFNESGIAVLHFTIDDQAPYGTYYIGSFGVQDRAGNTGSFESTTRNATGGVFTCEIRNYDPNSDYTPPTLLSCDVNGTELTDGGTVQIMIHAEDDLSGVKNGTLKWRDPIGRITKIPFSFDALNTSLITIEVSQYARSGDYYVESLSITDYFNNLSPYMGSSPWLNGTFSCIVSVNNSMEDLFPPNLIHCSPDKNLIIDEGIVQIKLIASDNLAGMAGGYITWYGPMGLLATYDFEFTLNSSIYLNISILLNAPEGIYYIGEIGLFDKVGNWANFNSTSINPTSGLFTCEIEKIYSEEPYVSTDPFDNPFESIAGAPIEIIFIIFGFTTIIVFRGKIRKIKFV